MNARPRKAEIIVLGRGLAAAALAALLVARGRTVALLVEEPSWERGMRTAKAGALTGTDAELAAHGSALLPAWQAARLPGISSAEEKEPPVWSLDYDLLLPALGEQVAAAERCWLAMDTHVRGISVIEGAILGAIAEDSRYDARVLVNAAEDERQSAFARMMREPQRVQGAWRINGVAGSPLLALGHAAQLAEQLKEKP